jgi:hypothetical protein
MTCAVSTFLQKRFQDFLYTKKSFIQTIKLKGKSYAQELCFPCPSDCSHNNVIFPFSFSVDERMQNEVIIWMPAFGSKVTKFQFFRMGITQMITFWVLTPCRLRLLLYFRGTCCHNRQNDRICIPTCLKQNTTYLKWHLHKQIICCIIWESRLKVWPHSA